VLEKFLSEEFPGSDSLRRQLVDIEARNIDSNGSLELRPSADAPGANVSRRVPVEAELKDVDGIKIHLLLHVVNGLLSEFEVYRDDSGPVERGLDVDELSLISL
jgi:hypothetical protein